MNSPTFSQPSSPISSSPTRSTMRHKMAIPSGFRPAPKPKRTPIAEMSVRELQDLHNTNTRLLASPYVSLSARPAKQLLTPSHPSRESTSADAHSWITRVTAEQDAIQGRLVELLGVDAINTGLKNTTIKGEDDMSVDPSPEPYTSPTLEAKRKALSRFVRSPPQHLFFHTQIPRRALLTTERRSVPSACKRPSSWSNKRI